MPLYRAGASHRVRYVMVAFETKGPKVTLRSLQRVLFSVLTLSLCFGPWFTSVAADKPALWGTVQRVIDGDTIDVKLDSGLIRVRLNAIDAPEKRQRWGRESTAYPEKRVANKAVQVEPFFQDRYERLVAVLYIDGANINSELVDHGYAWAFRKYMKKSDAALCNSEYRARKAKRGLWSLKPADVISPWEFRKRKNLKSFTDYFHETSADCIAMIGER